MKSNADFIVFQVVRCFEDNDVVHVNGKVDPKSDIDVINLELVFSDLDQVCSMEFNIASAPFLKKWWCWFNSIEYVVIISGHIKASFTMSILSMLLVWCIIYLLRESFKRFYLFTVLSYTAIDPKWSQIAKFFHLSENKYWLIFYQFGYLFESHSYIWLAKHIPLSY